MHAPYLHSRRHEGASFNPPADGNGARSIAASAHSPSPASASQCGAARPRAHLANVARARLIPLAIRPPVAAMEFVRSVDDNGSARASSRTQRSQRPRGAGGRRRFKSSLGTRRALPPCAARYAASLARFAARRRYSTRIASQQRTSISNWSLISGTHEALTKVLLLYSEDANSK